MSAKMNSLMRLPCFRSELLWVSRKKDIVSQQFTSRLMTTNMKGTDSTEKESPATESPPNQPVLPLNEADEAKSNGSFAKFFVKTSVPSSPETPVKESGLSFAALFRQSNFVHLGNARGRAVIGKIYRVVGDDLYVDFNWKFPCVIKRPSEDAHLYVNHAVVQLRILDLEMSTIFLGSTKETSLNEANCLLLGLVSSPLGKPQSKSNIA